MVDPYRRHERLSLHEQQERHSGITWYTGKYPNTGRVDVYLGGVLQATLDLYAPTVATRLPIWDSGVLPFGLHRLKVVLRSDKNPVSSSNYMETDQLVVNPRLTSLIDDSNKNALTFSGAWSVNPADTNEYNTTPSYTNVPGASFSYKFLGSGVARYSGRYPNNGKADVYVDTVWQATVDLYASTPQHQRQLWTSGVLPYGTHMQKVVVRADKNTASSNTYLGLDYLAAHPSTNVEIYRNPVKFGADPMLYLHTSRRSAAQQGHHEDDMDGAGLRPDVLQRVDVLCKEWTSTGVVRGCLAVNRMVFHANRKGLLVDPRPHMPASVPSHGRRSDNKCSGGPQPRADLTRSHRVRGSDRTRGSPRRGQKSSTPDLETRAR